jgi:hypothetical protein
LRGLKERVGKAAEAQAPKAREEVVQMEIQASEETNSVRSRKKARRWHLNWTMECWWRLWSSSCLPYLRRRLIKNDTDHYIIFSIKHFEM